MKNYRKWSKNCEEWNSYEKAKEEVDKLGNGEINELMEVANFISSRTLYGIVSNVVAMIALILSLAVRNPISIYYVLGSILLFIIIVLVVRGFLCNETMVQGANYILWAIHDKKM